MSQPPGPADRDELGLPSKPPAAAVTSSGAGRASATVTNAADATILADRSADQLQPGEVLGHTYRIEALLGKGGMGAVYRARHLILDSEHAIKIILAELAGDPKFIALMNQEAKALRLVRNDAVVEYQSFMLDETGRRYLVMEFVDGPSLGAVLAHRRFMSSEVRALRDRLAHGLAAAHQKGVFHRDISPDNIILPGSRIESAKIIDFGIAKAGEAGEKTIVGSDFSGKYSFASPEQIGMHGGKVDARSDIYSLGLVLAAAALGHGARLDMGRSLDTIFAARQTVPDLGGVPTDLRDEIAVMLQPRPADRPRSMEAVAAPGTAQSGAGGPGLPTAGPGAGDSKRTMPSRLVLGALACIAAIVLAIAYFTPLAPPDGPLPRTIASGPDTVQESASEQRPGERVQPAAQAEIPWVDGQPVNNQPLDGPPANRQQVESALVDSQPVNNQSADRPPVAPGDSRPIGAEVVRVQPVAPDPPKAPIGPIVPQAVTPSIAARPPEGGDREAAAPPAAIAMLSGPRGNRAALEAQIKAATQNYRCADIRTVLTDGGELRLSGFVSTAGDLAQLRLGTSGIAELASVASTVAVYEWPHCEIVKMLGRAGAATHDAVAPVLQFNLPGLVYKAGDALIVRAREGAAYGGYLYVDYFDNDGNAVHMLPTALRPRNAVKAGEEIVLGAPKQGAKPGDRIYEISEPFGPNLIIAITSPKPLFPRRAQEAESAEIYLPVLAGALEVAAKGSSPPGVTYAFINTVPK